MASALYWVLTEMCPVLTRLVTSSRYVDTFTTVNIPPSHLYKCPRMGRVPSIPVLWNLICLVKKKKKNFVAHLRVNVNVSIIESAIRGDWLAFQETRTYAIPCARECMNVKAIMHLCSQSRFFSEYITLYPYKECMTRRKGFIYVWLRNRYPDNAYL